VGEHFPTILVDTISDNLDVSKLTIHKQGDIATQYLTSKFYLEGIGVNKSQEKSTYWFNKAAAEEIFKN